MDKNIVILVLIVLLLASILAAVYFFIAEKNSQIKIQDLESSQQQKLSQISNYAKALDLILEPSRQQLGLATKTQTTKTEWLAGLSAATDKTNDQKLQDIYKKIMKGAPDQAMVPIMQYMDYAVKTILSFFQPK